MPEMRQDPYLNEGVVIRLLILTDMNDYIIHVGL
jgi:hypothetical protein